MSLQFLCLFIDFFTLSFELLCFLEINTLSEEQIAKGLFFPQCISFLSMLLIVSFTMKKLFSLMPSHLLSSFFVVVVVFIFGSTAD